MEVLFYTILRDLLFITLIKKLQLFIIKNSIYFTVPLFGVGFISTITESGKEYLRSVCPFTKICPLEPV